MSNQGALPSERRWPAWKLCYFGFMGLLVLLLLLVLLAGVLGWLNPIP